MYYYFSSDYPAVIKINGIFYGKIEKVIKPLKIDKGTFVFIEICPLKAEGSSINFILDNEFLTSPPNGISITNLKGGYMIKFYQQFDKLPFNILAQEKFSNGIVTVFTENSLKISIETPNDFYAETFNLNPDSATITHFNLNSSSFVAITFYKDVKLLYVYKIDGKITKVFTRSVFEYTLTPEFKTIENFKDIEKHTVNSVWNFVDGKMQRVSFNVSKSERHNNLNEKLIPYAFMESLLVGDDINHYLCENVKETADKLCSYFGDFIGVFPPPTFRDINEVGLIYSKSENVYEIEYFTFELKENKIFNIKKVSD